MKILITENQYKYIRSQILNDGVGDKYVETKYNINPEFKGFEDLYNVMKNKVEIVYYHARGPWKPPYIIYKNPKDMRILGEGVRGFIDMQGNLFIENVSMFAHDNLMRFLSRHHIIKYIDSWFNPPYEYLAITKDDYENIIRVAETFYLKLEEFTDEDIQSIQQFLDKCKRKNPGMSFEVFKNTYDFLMSVDDNDDYNDK